MSSPSDAELYLDRCDKFALTLFGGDEWMQDDHPGRQYLGRSVSPPLVKRRRVETSATKPSKKDIVSKAESAAPSAIVKVEPDATPAAIEAGKVAIDDHLHYFITLFKQVSRVALLKEPKPPTLTLQELASLYTRNAGSKTGHNFIVHQHDHPRAGLHYDLRLQINPTSSCSWSIPYGLPGNPWERRHGRRQAIETRIHCLWNHLIESASMITGSMVIWDIGEYEVLPFEQKKAEKMTDDEASSSENESSSTDGEKTSTTGMSEPQKLDRAFRNGEIRLRLKGTKLPLNYTISMRLSRDRGPAAAPKRPLLLQQAHRKPSSPKGFGRVSSPSATSQMDEIDFNEDNPDDDAETMAAIREQNAYPGCVNTIGSIHQRWWFLALDKENCGFVRGKDIDGKITWTAEDKVVRKNYPFLVRGRDTETSVVTARKAADVLADEGVVGFVPRGGPNGWKPALS